jgi:hypothetical protein
MGTLSPRPSGPAAAAFLSLTLGLVALAISHVISQGSEAAKGFVHSLGKLWMPGAQGIGPYSGKETIALIVWLGSWVILHWILRKREVSVRSKMTLKCPFRMEV